MSLTSHDLIERFRIAYGKDIDLSLRPAYGELLDKLGNPQEHLPPVFHVAGTNGKGSTCAFLRAMLEAAGHKVHVYTSPHLITFHERIRLSGSLISEEELTSLLLEVERYAVSGRVSYFEATTAAALAAFARHAADFTILETGLGGRLDATNVVNKPLATLITRLSYDHREYLGDTIDGIAREKAGIMRPNVPCFTAQQPDPLALQALRESAAKIGTSLYIGGKDWNVEETADGFQYSDIARHYNLPRPALLGPHQYQNAGLALAATSVLAKPPTLSEIENALAKVEWPARLQRLTAQSYLSLAPQGSEIWLDGGHNDSAGEALAVQIERWRKEDGPSPKPLCVIFGMLTTKRPQEFFLPLAPFIERLFTVPITNEPLGYSSEALAFEMRKPPVCLFATPAPSVRTALKRLDLTGWPSPPRILICGSLYLAGSVLAEQER